MKDEKANHSVKFRICASCGKHKKANTSIYCGDKCRDKGWQHRYPGLMEFSKKTGINWRILLNNVLMLDESVKESE